MYLLVIINFETTCIFVGSGKYCMGQAQRVDQGYEDHDSIIFKKVKYTKPNSFHNNRPACFLVVKPCNDPKYLMAWFIFSIYL